MQRYAVSGVFVGGRGKVYFAELRNAEFRKGVFCGISPAERSANYTLEFFPHWRIPQNSNKIK